MSSWVMIVYSTLAYESRAKAEQYAGELSLSFEKKFPPTGSMALD